MVHIADMREIRVIAVISARTSSGFGRGCRSKMSNSRMAVLLTTPAIPEALGSTPGPEDGLGCERRIISFAPRRAMRRHSDSRASALTIWASFDRMRATNKVTIAPWSTAPIAASSVSAGPEKQASMHGYSVRFHVVHGTFGSIPPSSLRRLPARNRLGVLLPYGCVQRPCGQCAYLAVGSDLITDCASASNSS